MNDPDYQSLLRLLKRYGFVVLLSELRRLAKREGRSMSVKLGGSDVVRRAKKSEGRVGKIPGTTPVP